jgi:hypothetical protein
MKSCSPPKRRGVFGFKQNRVQQPLALPYIEAEGSPSRSCIATN